MTFFEGIFPTQDNRLCYT